MSKTIGIGLAALLVIGGGLYVVQPELFQHKEEDHAHEEHDEKELVAKEPVRADGEFSIVTSFYPLAFMLEELTAGAATVVNIGEGRDPHDYRPSTADMVSLQSADLVVLQGADFEPWGDEVREQLEAADVPVVLASADVDLRELGEDTHEHHDHDEADHADDVAHDHGHAEESAEAHAHEDEAEHEEHEDSAEHDEHADEVGHAAEQHEDEMNHTTHEAEHSDDEADHAAQEESYDDHETKTEHMESETGHGHDEDDHDHGHDHAHGAYDPHTWVDPVHAQAMVRHLAESLRTLDPEQADAYTEREDALLAELAGIARQYDERLETCTVPSALVSHDAFGYLVERYDLTMHPIAGISTQDEPSARLLAELTETATEEGATTVLVEESGVAEFANTLATAANLQTATLNPMAFAIPEGETYLTLLEQNLDALVLAYDCE